MDNILASGLRLLLRCRTLRFKVAPTFSVLDGSNPCDQAVIWTLFSKTNQIGITGVPVFASTVSGYEFRRLIKEIRRLITECPASEREVVIRRYQREETIAEIASGLGKSEDEVIAILRRMRRLVSSAKHFN
jgi:hypothetical protein